MRILRCLPRPLYFLLLLLSLFSRIPAAVCYLQEYGDCRTPFLFRCGGELLNVSYPFTAEGRDGYCGAGEHYKLSCKDGIPVIEIDGTSFRVNRINYEAGVLSIADLELAKEACPRPYDNATLDWSLFEYTGADLNLTLHYNCTPVPDVPILVLHEVPCLALPGRQSYFTLEDPPDPWTMGLLGSCSSATVVPLGPAAVKSLNAPGPSSIQKAVKEGFDVRWTAGSSWCRDCLGSGGACGYNSSNPKAQICFCPYTWSTGACLLPIEKGTPALRDLLLWIIIILVMRLLMIRTIYMATALL